MKYMQLNDKCKKAIENEWCLGCQALENPNFTGNPNCKHNKTPSAEESIKKIKQTLGIQESFIK